jgi:hypothetical protein
MYQNLDKQLVAKLRVATHDDELSDVFGRFIDNSLFFVLKKL